MRIPALCLAAALLAGCASPWQAAGLPPGTARDQVLAAAGTPTGVVQLPAGGERLQYTLQPLGRFAYMFDLDPGGKLLGARQVLTAAEFARIEMGTWTRAEVEREFGPPAQIETFTSWTGPVMTYRWLDGRDNMLYLVYLDPQGIVRRAHPAMEFVNAPNERR